MIIIIILGKWLLYSKNSIESKTISQIKKRIFVSLKKS